MPLHLAGHEQVQKRVIEIHNLLQSPLASSILATHPNDLNGERDVPSEWGWWDSCGSGLGLPGAKEADSREEWLELVKYYNGAGTGTVHAELKELVDQIKALQLPRDPISIPASAFPQNGRAKTSKQFSYGMSPKKTHEVARMSAFVSSLLHLLPSTPSNGEEARRSRPRVVDVGAGQGYLTRALASLPYYPLLLALDGDAAQTIGAERWESRDQKRIRTAEKMGGNHKGDGITHKTIHITPETLIDAVEEWTPPGEQEEVMYVALHACGSLTLSILRAILRGMKNSGSCEEQHDGSAKCLHGTRVRGAVIVGCCYNLMEGADFPLSQLLTLTHPEPLPIAHRHLAAQIPGTWLHLENGQLNVKQDTALATRKVVWRAMVGRMIASVPFKPSPRHSPKAPSITMPAEPEPPIYPRRPIAEEGCDKQGTGETPTHSRLGKINARHYVSWEAFLSAAGEKMGIDFASSSFSSVPEWEGQDRRTMEMRLATLHVMRCLLGPLVESLILLDRLVWVREQLQATGEAAFEAELVNLFDQETGSGRNVAIVIRPKEVGDAAGWRAGPE